MRRIRKTHDLTKSDLKIVLWLNENTKVLDQLKTAYENFWEDARIAEADVHKYTYGNARISFNIVFPSYAIKLRRQSYEIPIHRGVAVGDYKDMRFMMMKVIESIWDSGMPTFNRRMDKWWDSVNNDPTILEVWPWVKGSIIKATERCDKELESTCASQESCEKIRSLEREHAKARIRLIFEEFKDIKSNEWPEIMSYAIMEKIHDE